MLELQDQALVELGNLDQPSAPRSKVTVGASTGPGEHMLPRLILGFRERFPAFCHLRVADTHEVIEEVLARQLEVGVVGAASHRDDLVVRPLARDEIVFVCAPGHPWAGRETSPSTSCAASRSWSSRRAPASAPSSRSICGSGACAKRTSPWPLKWA